MVNGDIQSRKARLNIVLRGLMKARRRLLQAIKKQRWRFLCQGQVVTQSSASQRCPLGRVGCKQACAGRSAVIGLRMSAAMRIANVRPTAKSPGPQPVATTSGMGAPAAPATAKVSVVSESRWEPTSEVDGSFVGNAPSDVQVPEGDHTFMFIKSRLQGLGAEDESKRQGAACI